MIAYATSLLAARFIGRYNRSQDFGVAHWCPYVITVPFGRTAQPPDAELTGEDLG
jgi:hypothetical protein